MHYFVHTKSNSGSLANSDSSERNRGYGDIYHNSNNTPQRRNNQHNPDQDSVDSLGTCPHCGYGELAVRWAAFPYQGRYDCLSCGEFVGWIPASQISQGV